MSAGRQIRQASKQTITNEQCGSNPRKGVPQANSHNTWALARQGGYLWPIANWEQRYATAADGRPPERRPSAPPPPPPTRSTTAAAGSGGRWDAAGGPRHPATAAEVAAGGAPPRDGGDRCEGNGPGGSGSCASAGGTGGGCASRHVGIRKLYHSEHSHQCRANGLKR